MAGGCCRENTVIYKLFPLGSEDLPKLRDSILSSVSNVLAPYIWQKEPFLLQIINGCLFGEVNFEDNIEDEWFIVYLLFEISKTFKNVFIEVQDDDGQFLLIEAADYLPKWMSPEVCSNRVFIFRGNMHVLSPKMVEDVRSAVEGGRYVAQHPEQTMVSPAMMKCIYSRINGYPELIYRNQHSVNCFIPANLAAILTERPQLVSVGVNAFCESILTSTKRPKVMSFFRPINRVLFRVTMTKCQYAQLMFHRFVSDRKEGWASSDLISSLGAKALDLGTKLAYGFEYACKRAEAMPTSNNAILPDASLWSSPAFDRFLKSLTENGYFRDNLEGSRDYVRLLNQARAYYADAFSVVSSSKSAAAAGNYSTLSGRQLLELVQRINMEKSVDMEKMKRENTNLPADDDDSWLFDFECSLNSIAERAGLSQAKTNGSSTNGGDPDKTVPVDELVSKVKKFVSKLSSAEGAEVEDENGDGAECRHVDSSDSGSEDEDEDSKRKSGGGGGKKEGTYMEDFLFESDEYSNDSSLDEDYSSDKHMKQVMKQMEDELRRAKNIGKDEVRTKSPRKVVASNLVKSYQAEGHRLGPAGLMLKQLRVKMPELSHLDSDDSD